MPSSDSKDVVTVGEYRIVTIMCVSAVQCNGKLNAVSCTYCVFSSNRQGYMCLFKALT